jgi:DtxR family transcriptional regulator, Mn-dependent transcriptional regulator
VILSVSEENYIKALYHLQAAGGKVSTNDLSREVQIKPASATDMLKKLRQKKLVDYRAYQGCRLSAEGNRIALGIIRKHRLWEYFLCTQLGFRWDEVHAIAEELEHISSPELISRLDAFLNFPTMDPHGDPIPNSNGQMTEVKKTNLGIAPLQKKLKVVAVSDDSSAILEMLNHFEIAIGSFIEIKKRFEFDSSIEACVNGKTPIIIPRAVAENIYIQ